MSSESKTSDLELKVHERFYDRIRNQINDENSLYNQRIIWLITMQAFLFATVGLILRGAVSAQPNDESTILKLVYIIISVTGIFVALICHRLLCNARDVLDTLGESWDKHSASMPADIRDLFPHPKGRVEKKERRSRRLLRSGNLPLVFVMVWPLFVAVLLVSWISS